MRAKRLVAGIELPDQPRDLGTVQWIKRRAGSGGSRRVGIESSNTQCCRPGRREDFRGRFLCEVRAVGRRTIVREYLIRPGSKRRCVATRGRRWKWIEPSVAKLCGGCQCV